MGRVWLVVCLWLGLAGAVRGDGPSLFGSVGGTGTPLISAASGGLFARGPGDLLARSRLAAPQAQAPAAAAPMLRLGVGREAQLFDLIAAAEAGPLGYDAVQYGARVQPPRRPTELTIGDIYAWIRATPGQPHAIGRYQIIPTTLRGLVRDLNVPESTRFSPELQDRMAQELLMGAGYGDFLAGQIGRQAFMHNISRVWAGLPTASGRSYYDGHAGNRSTITWAEFDAHMRAIFPEAA